MEAIIIINRNITLSKYDLSSKKIIGVEGGGLELIKYGIKDFTSYGDFDSISKEDIQLLKENSKEFIKLNPIKDVTDTYGAYLLCKGCSKITILGGISGKRVDHLYANINLVKDDNRVELLDDTTYIKSLDVGEYYFNNDYYFYSFYPIEDSIIDIKGDFRYKLDSYNLKGNDSLCISNQIDGKQGKLVVRKGRILLICSKNDSIY